MRLIKSTLVWVSALAGLALQISAAQAANTPQIGPKLGWVRDTPSMPSEKDDVKGLPATVLLNDTQLDLDTEGWTEFHEVKVKVKAPEGLQALSAIPFQWSPWGDTLVFHSAYILRDGQIIDVLPKDGAFTVLRRETGLEQAMLTGELTALLQPEGLQVGDVLDVAVSVRHADPVLKGRTGVVLANWDLSPIGTFRLEARWPSSLAVRWRETAGLPAPRRSETNGVITMSLALQDVRPPILPAHAPARFQHGRQIEFSMLADWKALAQVMAPLFVKASELETESPLAAQAALIANASQDPKVRTAAALQLVQGKVRYLAHAEAGGGYTPQSADETWRLRYGDCKAKTVLLLALLRELGVSAEPVLASTTAGDGLSAHLTSALLFDHVLVRAKVDGRDYWLDGARQGDRNLDEIVTPAYGWVLPLNSTNGELVHIGPAPSLRPEITQVIRYDASGGVTDPEPTQLKTTLRGDQAFLVHAQLSAVPPERLDTALKAYWAGVHTAFTPAHVAASWDATTGEETLKADGTSKLDWSGHGLELQNVELGGAPDIKRDPAASDQDAPYLVPFPSFAEIDESVLLPPGDKIPADRVKTANVDTVIAGVAYQRVATVADGIFHVVASQRALQPEISAAEARASVGPLTTMGEEGVYAPAGPAARAAKNAVALDSHPTTADDYLDRGSALLDGSKFKEALRDFDAAVALDPTSQRAWADRAVAHAWLSSPAALTDADKADKLGLPEVIAASARALLAANAGDIEGARSGYRHALKLDPADEFVLEHLIELDIKASDLEAARKDIANLLSAHPEQDQNAHYWRALIEQGAHHKEAAELELAQIHATTADARMSRARVYMQLGDKDLALADIDAAIKLKPSAHAWIWRASVDGGYPSATANADIDAALKLEPENLDARVWKVNAANSRGDYAAALQMTNSLLAKNADAIGNLLVGRAEIENQLGLEAEVDADFTRAQAMTGDAAPNLSVLCNGEFNARWRPELAIETCRKALSAEPKSVYLQVDQAILQHRLGREAETTRTFDSLEGVANSAAELNSICYSLASEGLALDRALAKCDAALKLAPSNAAILDSRAFTLMRLGRSAEALTAYNAALAANPRVPDSLYGRGLVEARLGLRTESLRDIQAALAIKPQVAKFFAKMGLT